MQGARRLPMICCYSHDDMYHVAEGLEAYLLTFLLKADSLPFGWLYSTMRSEKNVFTWRKKNRAVEVSTLEPSIICPINAWLSLQMYNCHQVSVNEDSSFINPPRPPPDQFTTTSCKSSDWWDAWRDINTCQLALIAPLRCQSGLNSLFWFWFCFFNWLILGTEFFPTFIYCHD